MSRPQKRTKFARRHSWHAIQDGEQPDDIEVLNFNDEGHRHQEDSFLGSEQQQESSDLTQTQLVVRDPTVHDDQSQVLQHCQPLTATNTHMRLHQPRPIRPVPAQLYQLAASVESPTLLFLNDQDAARKYRRRVTELPWLKPAQDVTIKTVERQREQHIADMVAAVYTLSNVLDNSNGREWKMFANDPSLTEYVEPYIIEATCRSVFDILLDRCYNGFRGQMKDDHARNASKDREADRIATCIERLKNVLEVLRKSKCACRAILYEDYKIILLVNHPLFFLRKKFECRRNNDQKRDKNVKAKAALEAAKRQHCQQQTLGVAQTVGVRQSGDEFNLVSTHLAPQLGYDLEDDQALSQSSNRFPRLSPQPQHQHHQSGYSKSKDIFKLDLQQDVLTSESQHILLQRQKPAEDDFWADGNPAPPNFDFSDSDPADQPRLGLQENPEFIADNDVTDLGLGDSTSISSAFLKGMAGTKRCAHSLETDIELPTKVPEAEDHPLQGEDIDFDSVFDKLSDSLLPETIE